MILHADVLAVDARLTKALYELSIAETGSPHSGFWHRYR
jgi:hypothetical protein